MPRPIDSIADVVEYWIAAFAGDDTEHEARECVQTVSTHSRHRVPLRFRSGRRRAATRVLICFGLAGFALSDCRP